MSSAADQVPAKRRASRFVPVYEERARANYAETLTRQFANDPALRRVRIAPNADLFIKRDGRNDFVLLLDDPERAAQHLFEHRSGLLADAGLKFRSDLHGVISIERNGRKGPTRVKLRSWLRDRTLVIRRDADGIISIERAGALAIGHVEDLK